MAPLFDRHGFREIQAHSADCFEAGWTRWRCSSLCCAVLEGNPFPGKPARWTVAIFLDEAPPKDTLSTLRGVNGEEVRLGKREIYVHHGSGMARSKLRMPAATAGTARNMNTVAKLAQLGAKR